MSSSSRSGQKRSRILTIPALLIVAAFVVVATHGASAGDSPPDVPLRLAWATFDPLLGTPNPPMPVAPAEIMNAARESAPTIHIVQFDRPVGTADRNAIVDLGAEVLDYVPDYAFLVRGDATSLDAVGHLPDVRWAGPLEPGFRLAPSLIQAYVPAAPGVGAPIDLTVAFARGTSPDAARAAVTALGGEVSAAQATDWKTTLRVRLDAARLTTLAGLADVVWIEAAPTYVLHNDVAVGIMGARSLWDNHGLYGAGQIVGVCDTGLDQGSTAPAQLHDDFEDGSGAGRVVALLDRVSDGASDVRSGHGTHVAGSILGNGDLSGADPASNVFPLSAHTGLAPKASLVLQAVENNSTGVLSGIPYDLNELFQEAYNEGVRVHNNSWGSTSATSGSYTTNSQDVDEFMWSHPDFLALFSSGNEGEDKNSDGIVDATSIKPPSTAKNCLTVGATESLRPTFVNTWGGWWPSDFPQSPVNGDPIADDAAGVAAFSGRGPTLDGRTKPDVAAPGTFIASTRSISATGTGWGAIDASYMYMGGTSMATPLTTGAAALVREYVVTHETFAPSAALVKGLLVNGATEIYPGQYGTGATQEITPTRPNPQVGWGRVNLDALFPSPSRDTWVWDVTAPEVGSYAPLEIGGVTTVTFAIEAASPLSATLAWTDYPGSPLANGALVNDLDLQITAPDGTHYYPNNTHAPTTYYLAYDDGGPENGSSWSAAGAGFAVRFSPGPTPAVLQRARFIVGPGTAGNVDFGVDVYDDDGTGGAPGTALCTLTTTATLIPSTWIQHVVDLSVCPGGPINVTSGDIYIAFRQVEANNPYLAYDTTAPAGSRSWNYPYTGPGGTWTAFASDYMIGADFAVAATSFDRTNNVVGIDIPAPTPGVYTLTVAGYNVPLGPQPYALVLSAAGRLLGAETVTRAVSGPGALKLGNTGATLTFTTASLTAVAVTVHRDTLLQTSDPGDALRLARRYYRLTATGGTGSFVADLALRYEEAELNGLNEADLHLYRWNESGKNWESFTPVRYPDENLLVVEDVTAFSTWVIGGATAPTAARVSGLRARVMPPVAPAALAGLGILALALGTRRRRHTH